MSEQGETEIINLYNGQKLEVIKSSLKYYENSNLIREAFLSKPQEITQINNEGLSMKITIKNIVSFYDLPYGALHTFCIKSNCRYIEYACEGLHYNNGFSITINTNTNQMCSFFKSGRLQTAPITKQSLDLSIGDIINKQLNVEDFIVLFDTKRLSMTRLSRAQNIITKLDNTSFQQIRLDNYDDNFALMPIANNVIRFFEDGQLKCGKICNDTKIKVKFHGKDYNLPFKSGENILFNDNKELSQSCIDKSPERSAIVYAERLNNLEKQQEETEKSVEKMKNNQTVATWRDWGFIVCCTFIGLYFLYVALCLCYNSIPLPFVRIGILPENFNTICFNYQTNWLDINNSSFNKYTFLYEILKRIPIIVSLVVAFKFLQLAFERIRQVGEVEKVSKYLKLTDNDDVKNNLLSIIAVPFFTHKKQKQPLLDRLVDKIHIDIDKEKCNNEIGNIKENNEHKK